MSDIGMGYGEMQIADLCKGYGIGPLHKEVIKEVIKDCSFTLEKSKLTVLIGPSGLHRAQQRRQVGAHQHAGGL